MEARAWRMVEETASVRYCLRNAFRLAIETEEMQEHIHYVEIYSSRCVWLVKLPRIEVSNASRTEAFLWDEIEQATQERGV